MCSVVNYPIDLYVINYIIFYNLDKVIVYCCPFPCKRLLCFF
jgi:hypothetical protein